MSVNQITLLLAAFLFCGKGSAQQSLLQRQTILLKKTIDKYHYKARPADDVFSGQVFDRMIDKLDEFKIYFTATDLNRLAVYRNRIDDEMDGRSWGFTDELTKLYKTRLLKADTIIRRLLVKPLNFSVAEVFHYGLGQQPPQDETEYALRWNRFLKWRVLEKLADETGLEVTGSQLPDKVTLLKQEPAARKSVVERSAKRIASYQHHPEALAKMIGRLYLQTIATSYDPHTTFLPPDEEEAFRDALSSRSMEYGFSLETAEDGSLKVGGITPGGAAWKSGNIHNNDKLLQLKLEGEAAIEVKEASPEEIKQVMQNHANRNMQVVVQSADGKINTINLQRQQQRNEDNIVKGFVLNGTKKIGYFSLPSFYTSWNDEAGSSCANDIAKEIIKLKRENIEGLILDLRYNGGGSVQEATELAGIFIDIGPMGLVRSSSGKTFVLKDPNRGTIYDGPMAVMINGQTASASEMVAGTLQDYQRALIIGSTSFGKATMQGIMPLDTTLTPAEKSKTGIATKTLGYVKTTVGKLFRITNQTAQRSGVVPDITLPDVFEAVDYTERSLPFSLPADTIIRPVMYSKSKSIPVTSLMAQSRLRMQQDTFFTTLQQTIAVLKKLRNQQAVPLKWEAYEQWHNQMSPEIPETLGTGSEPRKVFIIRNSAFDESLYQVDDYQKEMNRYVVAALSEDPYLAEAYQVMLDYLQTTQP